MTKCHFWIIITEKRYYLHLILLQIWVQELAEILCTKFQVILMKNDWDINNQTWRILTREFSRLEIATTPPSEKNFPCPNYTRCMTNIWYFAWELISALVVIFLEFSEMVGFWTFRILVDLTWNDPKIFFTQCKLLHPTYHCYSAVFFDFDYK